MEALIQGLKEAGFVEGRNIALEFRWADNKYDRLPALAADLIQRRVQIIAAIGNNLAVRAAKEATTMIPIVFAMGADPVNAGIVGSLNHPGGNVTGAAQLGGAVTTKRLQLLHDLVPNAKVFGIVRNPRNISDKDIKDAQYAVQLWGGRIEIADMKAEGEFEGAFASLAGRRVEALIVMLDSLFVAARAQLVVLAARYAIPAIFFQAEFAREGGLMSYNGSLSDTYHQAGLYAGRILKGDKPADLPVMLPTKFEFIINLKTIKSLGLTIPPGILAIADEVVE